tara:strand:- start:787 stop:951 length:165 start_codon:yes stop_codon:yes gene_type:complete
MVAGMAPNDSLAPDLAPPIIATAVYAGHRFARTLTMDLSVDAPFRREDVTMAAE